MPESETVIGVPEVVHPPLAGAVIPFSGPDTRGEIGNPAAVWLSPEGSTTAVSDGAYLYDHAPMWTRRRRASAGGPARSRTPRRTGISAQAPELFRRRDGMF